MQAGSKAAGHGDQGGGMQLMTGTRLLLYIPVRPATGSSMRACASLARASQPLSHLPNPTPGSAPPQMGETPLIRCAHNGHFQTVKFLVEQGADVNAVDMVRRGREAVGACVNHQMPSDVRWRRAVGGWQGRPHVQGRWLAHRCLHVGLTACRATTARFTGRRCAATVRGAWAQPSISDMEVACAGGCRMQHGLVLNRSTGRLQTGGPALRPSAEESLHSPPCLGPQWRLSSTCCSRARTGTCATSRTRWAGCAQAPSTGKACLLSVPLSPPVCDRCLWICASCITMPRPLSIPPGRCPWTCASPAGATHTASPAKCWRSTEQRWLAMSWRLRHRACHTVPQSTVWGRS